MSKTSLNSADQTVTNRRGTNQLDITISDHLGVHANVRVTRRWWQKLPLRAKAVAIALAISTLPVLANKTNAYEFTNQSIIAQITLAQEASANDSGDIASVPPRQLPLTLLIEMAVAALLLVGLVAAYLANRAIGPNLTATATTKKLDKEELESADMAFARLATQVVPSQASILEQQEAVAERTQLLTEITLRLRESVNLEDVFKTAVKEVRRALKADRVFFYRFNSDWSGIVVAEAVALGWPSCLNIKVTDTYFTETNDGIEKYKNGRVVVNDDIYKSGLSDFHINLLEQFAIKAQLIAPILTNNQLLGLMIANQCSAPRTWEKHEVDLFVQLATQCGFALEQVRFLEQQEAEAERVQLLTEITLRMRQSLDVEDLLKTTVKEVRRALKTERVVIFGLDSTNWDGIVVAESVAPGWPQLLRVKINDPCLRERHDLYKNGQITAINDISQDPAVKDCYRKMLEQFAVKAILVAPILTNNQLLGLLIAHQCSQARNWRKDDIDLFTQLATQVGLALNQASLLDKI